jgi:hypothetical protein
MDKASIIKDAIEYIQHLQEQEKIIQAEIMELESGMPNNINPNYDFDQELPVLLRSKKKRTDQLYDSVNSRNFPIEVLEVIGPLSLSLHFSYFSRRIKMNEYIKKLYSNLNISYTWLSNINLI